MELTSHKAEQATKQHSLDLQRNAKESLSDVDWDFSERTNILDLEGIHPYPAKFIGDIPRAFLKNLDIPEGSAVLDPFCGSGTTLVEAQRAGIPSIGIDLNPIACLITKVKTSPLPSGFDAATAEVVERARKIKTLPTPDIPNIDHWFKPDIQLAVGAIAKTVSDSRFAPWFDHLRLALSSILVRVSNQDSDTRYAAIDKNVCREDVFSFFVTAASKLQRSLEARSWALPVAKVIEGNTLEVSQEEIGANVGLVITSPPYPNAYEYWLYHKYRMWWLGFDPISVKEREIGARAHFFKKNHHTAEFFVDQMRMTFDLINTVLVENGYVCFIVGRSKIHGEIVDNGDIIEQVAQEKGLIKEARFERLMNANRKSFNLSHANIKTESVLVFKKC